MAGFSRKYLEVSEKQGSSLLNNPPKRSNSKRADTQVCPYIRPKARPAGRFILPI